MLDFVHNVPKVVPAVVQNVASAVGNAAVNMTSAAYCAITGLLRGAGVALASGTGADTG